MSQSPRQLIPAPENNTVKDVNFKIVPNNQPVVITLERTACFGACPIYKLTIFGDGRVVYVGERFVKVTGQRTTRISRKAVRELISEFNNLNYFSLADSYTGGPTDLPSAITSIKIGKKQKTVSHYLGSPDAPQKLTELENKIDAIVNSQQWVGSQPSTDSNTAQLQSNQQLWNQQNISSYRYTLQRNCFCIEEARQPVEVVVKDGKTISVTAVNSGKPVNPELFKDYNSIPKLFAVIQDAINRKAASLDVKYHPTLGYPTQINIDYDTQMADEELYLTVENLQPIR
ncbi:MAG: DUF6174 domain-containing protein [Nostocaceae cyanobacterium]|nr:DUF6174 domain-containing protein [Nostocaceae cyanobacterium]